MLKKAFFVSALLALALLSFGFAQNRTNIDCTEGFPPSKLMEVPDNIAQRILEMRQEIAAKGYTFEVAYNPAMRYSLDELCGFRPPNYIEGKVLPNSNTVEPMDTLPASFDWRINNGVTPVKDQLGCGSCWAFSITGAFESAILIRDGVVVDLSEQHLLDCNTKGYSCAGGFFDANDDYLNPGAALESCDPYCGYEHSCNTSCLIPYRLSMWTYVGTSSGVPSTYNIKSAIYNWGPVAAAVYADSFFQAYSSGIFNGTASGKINHAILLVGWDDADSCWIMKNSWGTCWGENGYMRIAYGCQQIGYAANSVLYRGGGGCTVPILDVGLNPNSLTLIPYATRTVNLNTAVCGFGAEVSLSASNLPSGATASFNPPSIAAPGAGSSTLTVCAGSAHGGIYHIIVTASGGGVTSTATLTLQVIKAPDKDICME